MYFKFLSNYQQRNNIVVHIKKKIIMSLKENIVNMKEKKSFFISLKWYIKYGIIVYDIKK